MGSKTRKYSDGKYAEIVNEIAEHIYNDSILSTERRAKIRFPDGNMREVDLLVKTKDGKTIVFEVRDRSGNQPVDWVDQVIGKYKDLECERIWICTFGDCNLSKCAIRSASYNSIGWRNIDLSESQPGDEPILYIDALKPIKEACTLTVNGDEYDELYLQCKTNDGRIVDMSLKEEFYKSALTELAEKVSINHNNNSFLYKCTINTDNLLSNMGTKVLNVELSVPITFYTIVDFFVEHYDVDNNGVKENIVISKRKSVFLSEDTITIDFGFLQRIRDEGYIISNAFIINTKAINERYGSKSKIRLIDIDGNCKDIPMRIYGIKR